MEKIYLLNEGEISNLVVGIAENVVALLQKKENNEDKLYNNRDAWKFQ